MIYMENYDLIGKTIRIHDRNAKVEDIIDNKVVLKDECGEEKVISLKAFNNLKPKITKELFTIKFNSLDNAMVYYYEGEDLKFVPCRPNDWNELEEFLKLENINYKGNVKDYLHTNEDVELESDRNSELTDEDIANIIQAIEKEGYKLIEQSGHKMKFVSKSKLEVKLLFESQIQKFLYNEFNRVDDLITELEDFYQKVILFDLQLSHSGKFKLVIVCE